MKRILLFTLAFITTGLAIAAGTAIELPPAPELDFAAWAADAGILAGVVIFLVAVIRKWVWAADGAVVPFLSIGVGAVLGVALHFLGHFDTIGAGVFHGLSGGFLAFGGVDALRGLFKIDGEDVAPAENNDTRAAAARLRR